MPIARIAAFVLLVSALPFAGSARAQQSPAPTAASRGMVYNGLMAASSGSCARAFIAPRSGRCLHGPDAGPAGVDVRVRRDTGDAPSLVGSAPGVVGCYGNGSDGKR